MDSPRQQGIPGYDYGTERVAKSPISLKGERRQLLPGICQRRVGHQQIAMTNPAPWK